MINNSQLRIKFKAIRDTQKQRENIGAWILGFLIIALSTAVFAMVVRLICIGIVNVHHLIK